MRKLASLITQGLLALALFVGVSALTGCSADTISGPDSYVGTSDHNVAGGTSDHNVAGGTSDHNVAGGTSDHN